MTIDDKMPELIRGLHGAYFGKTKIIEELTTLYPDISKKSIQNKI